MKKLNLTLIGLVLITVCCLAPICAADFNEDSISTDNSQLGTDYYDKLSIHVDDVQRGDTIVIDVQTAEYISTGVTVSFNGQMCYLWLEKGHGQLTFDSSDLKAGNYIVYVQSQAYDDSELEPASTTFNIYE